MEQRTGTDPHKYCQLIFFYKGQRQLNKEGIDFFKQMMLEQSNVCEQGNETNLGLLSHLHYSLPI